MGWLPLTLYDKTQIGPSAKAERDAWIQEHLIGKTCYGGLDLSATTDLTAFVLVFPPQEGLDTWVMLPRAWRRWTAYWRRKHATMSNTGTGSGPAS